MKVYNTQRWRDLRALKLARSPLCEVCLNAGRTKAAEHVDHIDSFTKYTGDARTCKAYDYCKASAPSATLVRQSKSIGVRGNSPQVAKWIVGGGGVFFWGRGCLKPPHSCFSTRGTFESFNFLTF